VLQIADYRPLLRPRTKRDAAVIVPNPAMESRRHMPLASSQFGERIAVVGVWELAPSGSFLRSRKSGTGKSLSPVRVDDAVMETPEPWARKLRDQRNVGDFRRWKDHDAYKQSFERVLRDLTKPK
jgi:hypothetical protein